MVVKKNIYLPHIARLFVPWPKYKVSNASRTRFFYLYASKKETKPKINVPLLVK